MVQVVETELTAGVDDLSRRGIGELDIRVGGRGVLLDGRSGLQVRVLSRTQKHLRVDVPQGEELSVVDSI